MQDAMVTVRMTLEKKEAEAIALVDSIPRKSRFSHMTDDEIRQERLIKQGLATKENFQ